jgi:hypothetical protein
LLIGLCFLLALSISSLELWLDAGPGSNPVQVFST